MFTSKVIIQLPILGHVNVECSQSLSIKTLYKILYNVLLAYMLRLVTCSISLIKLISFFNLDYLKL